MPLASHDDLTRAGTDLCALPDADLEMLLLIRHFERKLLALFAEGHIAGTTHTCLGQEYVPVALTRLLTRPLVFSNHRGHGHYLAQFDDPAGLLAEITGRAGAICGGAGGSQHLYREGFCSTGVQGENVALALGAALHLKTTGQDRVAVAYIGDGSWGEGAVYEALNMAQLWRVPLVVVVENNDIAQTTPTGRAMAGTIGGRAAAFGIRYERVDGRCVVDIRRQLSPLLDRVRGGDGPLVVEFQTVRLGPHSKGDDTRDLPELARIRQRDWAAAYARGHPDQFAAVDERQRRLVDRIAEDVLARPLASGGHR